MSQYAHLSTPDPEYTAHFARIPKIEPVKDVHIEREQIEQFLVPSCKEHFRPYLPQDSQYRVVDHQVPTGGGTILVRVVTPTPPGGKKEFPCLVFFHAGGFRVGSIELDDFRLKIISVELQISVVNVEYRLVPEHPFPAGLNDCYDALKWTAENAALIGVSLSEGFVIGGTSSGGNMVAAISHRARDDPFFHNRPLTGHILQFSPLVHPDAYPEKFEADFLSIFMEEHKEKTMFTREMMYEMYGHLGGPPTDPDVSPLLHPSHVGLPPLFMQVAGLDTLRDECLLYEKLLREVGVKTKLDIYPGVPHGFIFLFPSLKASVKAESDLKIGLKWLLDGAPLDRHDRCAQE